MTPPQSRPGTGRRVPLTVDLWQWSLEADAEQTRRLERLLSQEERDRADRLISERHRADFVAGRAGLRQILSRYCERGPDAISFSYGPHGKPFTPDAAVKFNISHSGTVAVAVVSPAHDIALGVDVERIRTVEHGLAQRFFSEAENNDLAQLDGGAWLTAFFRCWTRKEAVVKALGAGLSIDLSKFDVTVRADQAPRVASFAGEAAAGGNWMLAEFIPHDGYMGTIAVRADGRPVTIVSRSDPTRPSG